ncbi:MAG: hypothetical protein IMZ71_00585 [Chloroflexi bacterium]|nr:hypothetical protein [Chloroflexota bacterium]
MSAHSSRLITSGVTGGLRIFLACLAAHAFLGVSLAAGQDEAVVTTGRASKSANLAVLPAELLETAGLRDEARAEALAAIAHSKPAEQLRYVELLKRTHDRMTSSADASRRAQFEGQLGLGTALLRAHLYDEARAALVKAAELAQSQHERETAVIQAQTAATAADQRLWSVSGTIKKMREIAESAIAAAATGAMAFMLLLLLRDVCRRAANCLATRRGMRSSSVVLHDFDDATETGLGKGLPRLVQSLYADQQRLAGESRATGGLLVPRGTRGSLPLLTTAAGGDFEGIGLEIAGVSVGRVFGWWDRAWSTPRHNVRGTVYHSGANEVRATVRIEGASGRSRTLDAPLFGHRQPHDTAYRILFAILEEWSARS